MASFHTCTMAFWTGNPSSPYHISAAYGLFHLYRIETKLHSFDFHMQWITYGSLSWLDILYLHFFLYSNHSPWRSIRVCQGTWIVPVFILVSSCIVSARWWLHVMMWLLKSLCRGVRKFDNILNWQSSVDLCVRNLVIENQVYYLFPIEIASHSF